jgi:nucleoside-diphosphate-sugar epimerase
MNILISGGSGFIGKNIVSFLNKTGINVDTIGRSAENTIKVDLTNHFNINQKYDLIIHCAGKAHLVPNSIYQEELFKKINVDGTKNFLNSFEKSFIPKKFVLVSSVSVYGLSEGFKVNEDALRNANDPYGKSKIEAEDLVISWCEKNSVICTILRLPLVVAPNPPGNLGAMITAIKKGYFFNISNSNARKSMVLAADVAKIILPASNIGGIFNLTDGYHPTFQELSFVICKKIGKRNVISIPMWFAKILAICGNIIGKRFPINKKKLQQITSTLIFDDLKARLELNWNPSCVIKNLDL